MNDKELLEYAAKAMQATKDPDFQKYSNFAGVVTLTLGPRHGGFTRHWTPLTDDGDALRLAVKLQIIVGKYDDYANAAGIDNDVDIVIWNHEEKDPYAATRRAIVLVAAKIGKGMK